MIKVLLSFMLLAFASTVTAKSVTFDAKRTVRIVGEIDGSSIDKYAEKILKLIGNKKPIYLLINSPGGMVLPGTTVVDAIESAKASGSEVHCVAGSLAASMAFQMFTHCSHRYAFAHTKLLFHPMSIEIGGRVSELATLLTYLARVEKDMKKRLLKELNIPADVFEAHYAAETMWEARHIKEMSPKFLTIVTEVKGIKKLFTLTTGRSRHKAPLRTKDIKYIK